MAKRRIIPLFIPHVGCPNVCVFCDQVKISGADTPVTSEMVDQLIEKNLPAAGQGCEVAFYGGSFTAMRQEVQRELLAAVQPYLKSGAVDSIRLSTRPDAVNDGICRMLKEFGVITVELGCQSMDDRVLQLSRRGHKAQDTIRAVACLKRYGFSVILQMMTGLPGDTGRQSLETAEQIISLQPDGVRIYPTVVLRGTALEEMMRGGRYRPQTVEEAVGLCAALYERFLAENIPVIRVGLNPTEELSQGEAVAGAYHPALGELVLSELYLQRARTLLQKEPLEREAVFVVHPKRVSIMVGQKRRNIGTLRKEFGLKSIKVRPEAQELWGIFLKKT